MMKRVKDPKREFKILQRKKEEQEEQIKKIIEKIATTSFLKINDKEYFDKEYVAYFLKNVINYCKKVYKERGLEPADIVTEKVPPKGINIKKFKKLYVRKSFIIIILFTNKEGEARLLTAFLNNKNDGCLALEHLVGLKKIDKIKEIKFFLLLDMSDPIKTSGSIYRVKVVLEGKDENNNTIREINFLDLDKSID